MTAIDELPNDVLSAIEATDPTLDLTQGDVAVELVFGDRPYYSVGQMHAVLDNDVGEDTVRSRLQELETRGIAKTERVNNGRVYWYDREISKWGVPPDIDPARVPDSPTVEEWRRFGYVRLGGLGILFALVASGATMFGGFILLELFPEIIAGGKLLAYGLTFGSLSYFGLALAVVVWVIEGSKPMPKLTDVISESDN